MRLYVDEDSSSEVDEVRYKVEADDYIVRLDVSVRDSMYVVHEVEFPQEKMHLFKYEKLESYPVLSL